MARGEQIKRHSRAIEITSGGMRMCFWIFIIAAVAIVVFGVVRAWLGAGDQAAGMAPADEDDAETYFASEGDVFDDDPM